MGYWQNRNKKRKAAKAGAESTGSVPAPKPRYDRVGTITVQHGLTLIKAGLLLPRPFSTVTLFDQRVNVKGHSIRLETFVKSGTVCKSCGMAAKFFGVERALTAQVANSRYHLNMWGVSATGREILFTHDHIVALANGGADNVKNSQTMCEPCNAKKGNK